MPCVHLGCTIFACNAPNWVTQQLYQSRALSKILGNLFLQKVWETGSHVIASACAATRSLLAGVWDTKVSHGSSLHCIFVSFLSALYFPLPYIFSVLNFPLPASFSSSSSWFLHNAPSDLWSSVCVSGSNSQVIISYGTVVKSAIITCLTPPQSSEQTVCGEINSNFPFWPLTTERLKCCSQLRGLWDYDRQSGFLKLWFRICKKKLLTYKIQISRSFAKVFKTAKLLSSWDHGGRWMYFQHICLTS